METMNNKLNTLNSKIIEKDDVISKLQLRVNHKYQDSIDAIIDEIKSDVDKIDSTEMMMDDHKENNGHHHHINKNRSDTELIGIGYNYGGELGLKTDKIIESYSKLPVCEYSDI